MLFGFKLPLWEMATKLTVDGDVQFALSLICDLVALPTSL